MLTAWPEFDAARLRNFHLVQASDTAELDLRSRVSARLPETGRAYQYRLRDRALWHRRFDSPVFSLATRSAGTLLASYGGSSFATEVSVEAGPEEFFCFTAMLRGEITLLEDGPPATATVSHGLAMRPGPGMRLLTSDASARANLFLGAAELEAALEQMLDDRLRTRLCFVAGIDWASGLAASLRRQMDVVMEEFQRSDGLAANPPALAFMTDLLQTLALRGIRHSHSEQLASGGGAASPAYVRRAEEFMRHACGEPLRIRDVAAAAGCSVRTLGAVFRRFRGNTPLAALHAIRLEAAHREIGAGAGGDPVAAVARRHGFSNAARFSTAFRRRFGVSPAEMLRRRQP